MKIIQPQQQETPRASVDSEDGDNGWGSSNVLIHQERHSATTSTLSLGAQQKDEKKRKQSARGQDNGWGSSNVMHHSA
eukprot:GSA25T00019205001.1